MKKYLIEDLAMTIAKRAEISYCDVIEDLYLKIHQYHIQMYGELMISLYFMNKSISQVIAYYNIPTEDSVNYIVSSVTNGLIESFINDYNDEDDSE